MAKVLFVSSEASPLIKTGGLADVCGNLPLALKDLRWSVRLLLPAYPQAKQRAAPLKTIARIAVPGITQPVKLLQGKLPDSGLPVWLVDSEPAYGRDGNPYLDSDGNDWPDNAERFTLLARVVVDIALGKAGLSWKPDIVHCNDWQTGLIPALLSQHDKRPATVFTIHNLAYQGLFPSSTFQSLGLPASLWSPDGLEFYDQISFIKGGLVFADRLTTVSPSYAREIQTSEFGCGMEGLLRYRKDELTGILNGINDKEWDPEHDPYIMQQYGLDTLHRKSANKKDIQEYFGLPQDDSTLLLGSVGRIVEQKGIDLLLDIIQPLSRLPLQIALLGSGNKALEKDLKAAASKLPDRISVHIGYDESLAHRIEAGSDAFLMPSRFEPCGLNQLYSLRYGTLPIVNSVGGLKDTVVDINGSTLKKATATGFCFNGATPQNLLQAIKRATDLYGNKPEWNKVAMTGMRQVFNWKSSAQKYGKLYRSLLR